jgi:hypothetical protein
MTGGRESGWKFISQAAPGPPHNDRADGQPPAGQVGSGKQCAMNIGGSRPPLAPSSIYHQ